MPPAILRLLLGSTLLVAGGTVAGCDSGESLPEPVSKRIELVIGDALPLSGPSAALGASAQKAAQLAVEKVNDAIAEANVPHAVEIVHRDAHADGPRAAALGLVRDGASCLIGPRSATGARAVAAIAARSGRALAISTLRQRKASPGAQRKLVVGLPPTGAERALDTESESPDPGPSVSFARLYASTDPPIGPARTSDGRQFDTTLLCYLAAVAAGSERASRLAGRLGPVAHPARSYGWQELPDAVEALSRRRSIEYLGVTLRIGVSAIGP